MGGGNDYVIQVKGNQPKLLKRIIEITQEDEPLDAHKTQERSRGRHTTRYTQVFANSGGFDKGWQNLNRIIKVTRSGTRKRKEFKEEHYYISSKTEDHASYFAQGIRSHWGIENKLHWIKDAIMNEDKCRIKSKTIVGNLSLIRSGVISLFRVHNYASITQAIELFNNRLDECISLMNGKHIYQI